MNDYQNIHFLKEFAIFAPLGNKDSNYFSFSSTLLCLS
jgi:hypothetical protein